MNHKAAIETILNTKTRQAIIDHINGYGDPITWDGWETSQILDEVSRSDNEAGEEENGILANLYAEC
jgi:hypothetical protein